MFVVKSLNLPELFERKLIHVANVLVNNAIDLQMEELWLFGSVARGDYNAISDLDLMVITSSGNRKSISVKVELLDVRDDIGYPHVDVVVRTFDNLNSEGQIFNREVLRDRIVLWRKENVQR